MRKTDVPVVDILRQKILFMRSTICSVQQSGNAAPIVSSLNLLRRLCDEAVTTIERHNAGFDLRPEAAEASTKEEKLSSEHAAGCRLLSDATFHS